MSFRRVAHDCFHEIAGGRDLRGRVPHLERRVIRWLAAVLAIGALALPAASTAAPAPVRFQKIVRTQHPCLARIFDQEDASWDPTVSWHGGHDTSASYGLGQADPGTNLAAYRYTTAGHRAGQPTGRDWATNAWTQLRWFVNYAVGRYGSECAAWAFWLANRWW